jgi:hypothetical protein
MAASIQRACERWLADRDPRTFLAPTAIAENYWNLHAQDPSTWSQEIDLRPSVEKF